MDVGVELFGFKFSFFDLLVGELGKLFKFLIFVFLYLWNRDNGNIYLFIGVVMLIKWINICIGFRIV